MKADAQLLSISPRDLSRSYSTAVARAPFAAWTGFYFSLRLVFPLLAARIFVRDPQDGVIVSLLINYLLLALAVFGAWGSAPRTLRSMLRLPIFRWVLFFLIFSGFSLLWSISASMPAAVAFWCAMAADTMIVVLLLRGSPAHSVAPSLMTGYIWGSCGIALVAWILPAQADLRLGDEQLLGPNQIGWSCAFAFFLAQYLARLKAGNWTIQALLLGITILRSLSKTTIIAFVVGESYILLQDRSMSRQRKWLLVAVVSLAILSFSGLLANYYQVYTNAGNQSETFTGRLSIWLFILNEALQKPWFGHGFHAVWKVIPPFGEFDARHAHNEFLQQFYAYGIVGVLMLLAMYASLWRHLRKLHDRPLRVFLVGMLLFVVVRGLADTEAFDLSLPVWFLTLMGAIIEQSPTTVEVRR